VVLFVQAAGGSLANPRDREVALALQEHGLATLLVDLLTPEERDADQVLRHLRYDVEATTRRVVAAIDWLAGNEPTAMLSVGLLGIGVGAAAALAACAERPEVAAVVARGGRPDLAGSALPVVQSPALFIVGGQDTRLEELSLLAMHRLPGETGFAVVPGATHLFEDAASFAEATALTIDWFDLHLVRWMRRSGERVIPAARRAPRRPPYAAGRRASRGM
jgi:dienelactone hydrolase